MSKFVITGDKELLSSLTSSQKEEFYQTYLNYTQGLEINIEDPMVQQCWDNITILRRIK